MGNHDRNREIALKTEIPENGSGARRRPARTNATAVADCWNNSSSTNSQSSSSSSGVGGPNCLFCSKTVAKDNLSTKAMFRALCKGLELSSLQFPDVFPKKLCFDCDMKVKQFCEYQKILKNIKKKIGEIVVTIQDKVAADQILRPKSGSSSDPFYEIKNAFWEGYKERLRRQEEEQNNSDPVPNPIPGLAIKLEGIEQSEEEDSDEIFEEEVEKNPNGENAEVIQIETDDDEEISAALGNSTNSLGEGEVLTVDEERLPFLPWHSNQDETENEMEQEENGEGNGVEEDESGEGNGVEGNEIIGAENEEENEMEQEESDPEAWAVGTEVIEQYRDSNSTPLFGNSDSSGIEGESAAGASTSAEINGGGNEETQEVGDEKEEERAAAPVAPRKRTKKVRARPRVPTRIRTRSIKHIKQEMIMRRADTDDEEEADFNQNDDEDKEVFEMKARRKLFFNNIEIITVTSSAGVPYLQCSVCSFLVHLQPHLSGVNTPFRQQQAHIIARHPNAIADPVDAPPVDALPPPFDALPLDAPPQDSSDSSPVPTTMTCDLCPEQFSSEEALNQHKITHLLRNSSPRPALSAMNLKVPRKIDGRKKKKGTTSARTSAANPLGQIKRGPGRPRKPKKKVVRTPRQKKIHKCELCSRTFGGQNYLNLHLKTHGIKTKSSSTAPKESREDLAPKGVQILRSKAFQIRQEKLEKQKQAPGPDTTAGFFHYLGLKPINMNMNAES